MRIFLTGGTGFIGRALVPRLRARGWEVCALARDPDTPSAKALDRLGAVLLPGDLANQAALEAGITGADTVIHNAGHYEFGIDAAGRRNMYTTNVTGTDTVLRLALTLGVARCLYVSTAIAYGDSGPQMQDETFERQAGFYTYYEQTKTEAHRLAVGYQQRGLPLTIICPNGVIGTNDHSVWGYFLRFYINNLTPPYAWVPESTITLVDVDDVAEGIALAVEHGCVNEVYFLTGESKTRQAHLGYWASRMNRRPFTLYLPAWLAALTCMPLEPLLRYAGLPAFISRESVRASVPHFNFSSVKAQKELGWQPISAREMWFKAIDGELALLAARKDRGILSRLKPIAI